MFPLFHEKGIKYVKMFVSGSLDMGQVDVAEFIQELLEVMKNNRIVMPHGFTMLARGIFIYDYFDILVQLCPVRLTLKVTNCKHRIRAM